MCGIAGLFSKSGSIEESLGAHLGAMLTQLAERGPDSAGVALYRDPAPAGTCKVSLFSPQSDYPWPELAMEMAGSFGAVGEAEIVASHALLIVQGDAIEVQRLAGRAPSRAAGDEHRRADRDLQGGRRPA